MATFSRNLAKGLAGRGHDVLVIAPSQTGKKSKEIDGNHVIVRVSSLPFPFYQNFRISVSPYREVKKIIDEFKPDIMHIQMLLGIGQATMRYGNKIDLPIVSTNHAMPENLMDNLKLLAPVSRPINYMLTAYGARFHSKSDFITLPTQSAIDMFNAKDKIITPIAPVSNGIDLARFKPGAVPNRIYETFNIPRNVPIISYVGRVDAEKHLPVLVRAFSMVSSELPAHLLIVGDGTEKDSLENLTHELGVHDNVTFTGRVSDTDIELLHRVGTVFCMPSPAELQSIATLEAMASGQPVVAITVGALKELCQHNKNGFLCKKDNEEEIAKGLLAIIKDKKLRDSFSKESLNIAHTHSLETTLDEFEAIYQKLVYK